MNKDYFKNITNHLNLSCLSEDLTNLLPIITGDFSLDANNFSNFWKNILEKKIALKKDNAIKKNELYDLNEFTNITKKIFLNAYAIEVYKRITKSFERYIRVEDLCFVANEVVPYINPSVDEIKNENKLFLKEKEGLEKAQGIFLSAILSNKKEGIHLCKAMLLPTKLSLNYLEEFNSKGKVTLDGAIVESFEDHTLVTLNNPSYLNAEDNRTLIPLEAAIDLAILNNKTNISVLRGSKVSHSKYLNKRIFGAGINLTHLYEGKIPFLWYITRDMGAVNKVLRGHSNENADIESSIFPHKNKIWFACLETFAIGGGCQYLLVMDHILADKKSYMTLPARKEGIIPGAANLRLWRYVGNRVARQAIQHGLTIKADSSKGSMICDKLIDMKDMDITLNKTISEFKNSGVVGATYNKRALTLGEEDIDDFRKYMAIYCHDQAYCHFSYELVNNLEKYWHKAKE